jgi:two-component system OmpR family sensor kinase
VPLRLRLTGLFTLASVLVVVLGGVLYLHQLKVGLLDATDASVLSRAAPLRAGLGSLPSSDQAASPAVPSNSDVGGLLTRVVRPDGTIAEESPSLAGERLVGERARSALSRGRTVLVTTSADDIPYRVLAEPVSRADGMWTLIVAAPLVEMQETVENLRHSLFIAGGLVVLLAAAGAWLLGSAALRAVDRMRRSVEGMTADDLSARVRVPPGRDELAALGNTFNALLDRLAHGLVRQRRFVADAGHELRGPLAVLQMELELADRPQRTREELAAAVRAAAEEVERLARLANDLLFLARSDDGELQVVTSRILVEPLLRQAAAVRGLAAAEAGITIEVRSAPGLWADLDADRIRHALDNLLANALRASTSGGIVVLVARQDAGSVHIGVLDSGPGFAEEFLPRAFERFTRPDRARSDDSGGSGLGLAIVQAVAEAHGGRATAANRVDGGAEVEMVLPAVDV